MAQETWEGHTDEHTFFIIVTGLPISSYPSKNLTMSSKLAFSCAIGSQQLYSRYELVSLTRVAEGNDTDKDMRYSRVCNPYHSHPVASHYMCKNTRLKENTAADNLYPFMNWQRQSIPRLILRASPGSLRP